VFCSFLAKSCYFSVFGVNPIARKEMMNHLKQLQL
jgi:hypothetical protein